MDEFEWSSEFTVETAWYLVQHVRCMLNCIKPECSANLFFCDVRSGHFYDGAPGSLDQTIGKVSLCWGCDDFAMIGLNKFKGFATHEFLVEVRVEGS